MHYDPTMAPDDAPTVATPAASPRSLSSRRILFLCDAAGNWIVSNLKRLGKFVGNPLLDLEVTEGMLPITDQWDDAWIPVLKHKGFDGIQLVDEKGVGVWAF